MKHLFNLLDAQGGDEGRPLRGSLPVATKNLDQIESIDVAEMDWYFSDPIITSLPSVLFSLQSWFRTRAALQIEILGLRPMSLAKTKTAFEMNNKLSGHETCHMDEIQLLQSFGDRQDHKCQLSTQTPTNWALTLAGLLICSPLRAAGPSQSCYVVEMMVSAQDVELGPKVLWTVAVSSSLSFVSEWVTIRELGDFALPVPTTVIYSTHRYHGAQLEKSSKRERRMVFRWAMFFERSTVPMFRFRFALPIILCLTALTASAKVQTVGDVSFSVPEGWNYEQKPGEDHATIISVADQRFIAIVVYSARPSSGNADADFQSAWKQIVLGSDYSGMPYPIYDIHNSVGYPGKETGDASIDRKTYTWMYLLETGHSYIPVAVVSSGRYMFDALENELVAFIGSVRQAPLKAEAIKTSITVADLAGSWRSGAASSTDYVNSAGQYAGNSTSFYGASYTIASDGHYSYSMSGKSNGSTVREKEEGVVELSGDLVVFKGTSHTSRFHFINSQQALDGSTVLTLLDEGNQPSSTTILNYGQKWTRPGPRSGTPRK